VEAVLRVLQAEDGEVPEVLARDLPSPPEQTTKQQCGPPRTNSPGIAL